MSSPAGWRPFTLAIVPRVVSKVVLRVHRASLRTVSVSTRFKHVSFVLGCVVRTDNAGDITGSIVIQVVVSRAPRPDASVTIVFDFGVCGGGRVTQRIGHRCGFPPLPQLKVVVAAKRTVCAVVGFPEI